MWMVVYLAGITIRNDLFGVTSIVRALGLKPKCYYRILDFIPEGAAEVDKLKLEIAEAMYQLGVLYRDKLEQYNKSIAVHEELLKKYPGNARELETYFYLYLSYQDIGKTAQSDKYKQLILDKYPETNYAKALENPDLLNEALNKEEMVKSYYDEVYDEFQKENYELAYEKIQSRESKFEMSTTYASKFDLLAAMCLGHMRGRSEYIRSLREVIGRHRGTEESKRAKEILDVLGLYTDDKIKEKEEETGEEEKEEKELDLVDHNFKYNPEMMHYVVVSYNSSSVSVNQAKIAFSNFNNKFFRLERLKVSNIFLDTSGETPLLTVRKFQDAEKARDYVNTLIEKYDEVMGGKSFTAYPISQLNYRELIRIKSVDTYENYYRETYIK
jgi:tetratricopeptide (TPR) repeat protein